MGGTLLAQERSPDVLRGDEGFAASEAEPGGGEEEAGRLRPCGGVVGLGRIEVVIVSITRLGGAYSVVTTCG